MTMVNPLKLSEDPLAQAKRTLLSIRKMVRISFLIPIPVLLIATYGFFKLDPKWIMNPFMVIIFAIFTTGQVVAVFQMKRMLKGVKNTEKAVAVLAESGDEPDLLHLRDKLLTKAPAGHLRDLLLRWIELGLRGETVGSESLLDNAWERRTHHDNRSVSLHVSLNRTTLKVGFLGTLYGLILTFPPMKRAVMGLADSEGEMRFIRDISKAIDGDEYAILVTLGATALSILIELVTVQILERALGGFDMVNSHINDWNLTRLQPWIRKHYTTDARQRQVIENQATLEVKMSQTQIEIDRNLTRAIEAIAKTTKQIENLSQVQASVGRRLAEMMEYERQYRGFISTKQQAAGPPSHRISPLEPLGEIESSHKPDPLGNGQAEKDL
jgi:hypothetical protein